MAKEERLVTSRVCAITSTANEASSNSVTVRQTPLTAIEAP